MGRGGNIRTVCYFGDYDPSYGYTRTHIEGLRENNAEVVECRESVRTPFFRKCRNLRRMYRNAGEHDVVVVGFTDTHWMPIFARLLTRKPLVWDMGYSLYDNWVFDRKLVRPHSPKAAYHWIMDWLPLRFVDRVLLPTNANIDYISRTFGADKRKFSRVAMGADTNIFFPRPRTEGNTFRVEFHGKYIPVQGADVIVRAAKLLENEQDIRFTMIGDGQEKQRVLALAEELQVKNIDWHGFLPGTELPTHIAAAHVCIGLVGTAPRIEYSVPNKLCEAAAMGRVSINADTAAVREFFENGRDVVLIKRGDAEELAAAIQKLKREPAYREKLERGALETFQRHATTDRVGRQLVEAVEGEMHRL